MLPLLWMLTLGTPALDANQVIAMAQAQAPAVQAAQARLREAQAVRVGAGAWAPTNPELGFTVGPAVGSLGTQRPITEFMVSLKWPIDVSGAPWLRSDWASAHALAAQANLAEAQRSVVAQALESFVQVVGCAAHAALAAARLSLDDDLLRSAQVRKQAGAAGDGDVALATVLQAQSRAGLLTTQGACSGLQATLREVLQLPADAPLDTVPLPAPDPVPSLASLTQHLPQRADVRHAQADAEAASLNAALQNRLAAPVPRLTLEGARNPEYTLELGLEVPLPVYQRNQTNAAVAEAQQASRTLTVGQTLRHADTELRVAHAQASAAAAAFAALQEAAPAMDDAEHLAVRGFALGQTSLTSLLAARRETVQARGALIDAQVAAVRSVLLLKVAAGAMP